MITTIFQVLLIVLYPDTTKLRALGWTPYYDVMSGFKRTINFYLKWLLTVNRNNLIFLNINMKLSSYH